MEIEGVMTDTVEGVEIEIKVMIHTEVDVEKDKEEVEAEVPNIMKEYKKNTEDNAHEITLPMTNTEEIIIEEGTDIQNLQDHAHLRILMMIVIDIVDERETTVEEVKISNNLR